MSVCEITTPSANKIIGEAERPEKSAKVRNPAGIFGPAKFAIIPITRASKAGFVARAMAMLPGLLDLRDKRSMRITVGPDNEAF